MGRQLDISTELPSFTWYFVDTPGGELCLIIQLNTWDGLD